MNDLTTMGRKRYEILRPKVPSNFNPKPKLVQSNDDVFEEVKNVIKEQMANQKKVCTHFGFIREEDEIERAESGYSSIIVVETYSYEELLTRVERIPATSKMTAAKMVFEPHYLSEDLTWIIIVCNN